MVVVAQDLYYMSLKVIGKNIIEYLKLSIEK